MRAISVAALTLLLAACGEPAPPPLGEALYAEHCLVCHQADGGGVPFMQPPLVGSVVVVGPSEELIRFVLRGSAARAPDDRRYDNEMPPFDALGDAELAALLSHVRARFGEGAGAVAPEEVAAARTKS